MACGNFQRQRPSDEWIHSEWWPTAAPCGWQILRNVTGACSYLVPELRPTRSCGKPTANHFARRGFQPMRTFREILILSSAVSALAAPQIGAAQGADSDQWKWSITPYI